MPYFISFLLSRIFIISNIKSQIDICDKHCFITLPLDQYFLDVHHPLSFFLK